MKPDDFTRKTSAILIHFNRADRQFKQGVGLGIKSGGFNIDNHGQKAAKSLFE